ncbi:MAG: GerMN domain-containing protein [Treponema sp.]|jgi:hypothetical protein|nr:GerMN domain-containing protein [Treponema sp.]
MNSIANNMLKVAYNLFGIKRNRYLVFLALISLIALGEYLYLGLVRRTFVFYSALEGATIVEDRLLRRSNSPETDIRRYTEEALLGPVSPEASLLFPRETRLQSLIFRDGVVYADFSEESALALGSPGVETVFTSFLTLYEGIMRNFSSVKDVRLFIGGNEIFFNEFRAIFEDSADNFIKPVKRR